MAKYRAHLPQTGGRLFLTDAGIETTLIYRDGFDLPCFAAFHLLRERTGRAGLKAYYRRHAEIAKAHDLGFVLESPTWRASPDWGVRLGYSRAALAAANRDAIALMGELAGDYDSREWPFVISGCVGPRGDGYDPGRLMSAEEARAYHGEAIGIYAEGGADLITAITMTNVPEAVGVVRAAQTAGLPAVISFTLETDGRLPTGESLEEAIARVDEATASAPAYYMINCAHPTHFAPLFAGEAAWALRLGGLRANASKLSHAELDRMTTLDDGDPEAFGAEHAALLRRLPRLAVLGGCCGTDERHIARIAQACAPLRKPAAA